LMLLFNKKMRFFIAFEIGLTLFGRKENNSLPPSGCGNSD
jgi:hypothetical protein